MNETKDQHQIRPPGSCLPWEQKVKELPPIAGNRELVERIWKDVDGLGYLYIWHCLLSF